MKFHVKMEGTGNDSKISFGQNKTPFHDSKVHFLTCLGRYICAEFPTTKLEGKVTVLQKAQLGKPHLGQNWTAEAK